MFGENCPDSSRNAAELSAKERSAFSSRWWTRMLARSSTECTHCSAGWTMQAWSGRRRRSPSYCLFRGVTSRRGSAHCLERMLTRIPTTNAPSLRQARSSALHARCSTGLVRMRNRVRVVLRRSIARFRNGRRSLEDAGISSPNDPPRHPNKQPTHRLPFFDISRWPCPLSRPSVTAF